MPFVSSAVTHTTLSISLILCTKFAFVVVSGIVYDCTSPGFQGRGVEGGGSGWRGVNSSNLLV